MISTIFKVLKKRSIFIIMLTLSCCNTSVKDFLEQEFGIQLTGKIILEKENNINGNFSGDYTNLKVFKIKEDYYDEIKEAALKKRFQFFEKEEDLPFTDQIFIEYIKGGKGLYKYYKGDSISDFEIIILNEQEKLIIYYFCHI